MKPEIKNLTATAKDLFSLNGGEAFGFEADTVISGNASGTGVKAVMWPAAGVICLTNTSGADRVVNLNVKSDDVLFPMIPQDMTLQAGFFAIVSVQQVRVYNNFGELQTGFSAT